MTTSTGMSLMEALRVQRSIRRFSSKPVPDDAIRTILRAATLAPSGANRQPWRFVVVRDPAHKRQIGEWYDEGSRITYGDRQRGAAPRAAAEERREPTFSDVPMIILVCVDALSTNPGPHSDFIRGASVYPAMQNLMLAATALGLGTRPTTMHRHHEADIKALLGIPESVDIAAIVPLGYLGEGEHFGGKKRKPLAEVAFQERWGQSIA
ncbi:MAG: nitroreductase family protein [Chloroflexi bacterium]|nr:nitroreductase family protein [Chloroflexota bacterium]